MTSHPLVSIILPSYNHAAYLPARLDSILRQTFREYEVIFIDDCSTDNSREIAREYAARLPMTLIRTPANTGNPFVVWNIGLARARGEYVWIAETDDVCDPRFLERMLAYLVASPETGLAYCQSLLLDDQGRILGSLLQHTDELDYYRWRADYRQNGWEECRAWLLLRNVIPNVSACLWRRSALVRCGGADVSYWICGDWATYARTLLAGFNIAYCAEHLNGYRTHATTVREKRSRDGTELQEILRVQCLLKAQVSPDPTTQARASLFTCRRAVDLAREDPAAVSRWFLEQNLLSWALALDPWFLVHLAGAALNRFLTLDVYTGRFEESDKQRLHYEPNAPRVLECLVPAGPLRIDPSEAPGLLRLHEILLLDPHTGQILDRFADPASWRRLRCGGTCFALADAHGLLLHSFGNDPFLVLPTLETDAPRVRLRLTLTGYCLEGAMDQTTLRQWGLLA